MNEKLILNGFEYAKARYAEMGVDVEAAMAAADKVPVSMHCWQGDDVIGFDGVGSLSGGIATTGNYPGRARTPQELRADIDKALSLIPGATKLNLHACYAEKNGKKVDRDEYTVEQFQGWLDWAADRKIGLDFNPTYFSHPMMDGDFSLSSTDEKKRRFWVEHGIRCREIALEFAKRLGQPCAINYWMPDGYKDTCADTYGPRKRMEKSLDEIFAPDIDETLAPCGIESKLFGIGVESYTVASHEFSLGYAIKNHKMYTLDSGHFHPTEVISAKITAVLLYVDKVLMHISRGIRWDSDHAVTYQDELQAIMDELVFNGLLDRAFIGQDYFDASINRIACWAIGMRSARKALLSSFLAPAEMLRKFEAEGDLTSRLAMMEERKNLPMTAVWDYYCLTRNVPVGENWLASVKQYEKDVLSLR